MLPSIRGAIAFDHVVFRYTDKETGVEDFSLDIRAGETLALVGHTGCGQVAHRQAGRALLRVSGWTHPIDGHRHSQRSTWSDYHAKLGIVTQSPFLFDGTVQEKFSYGRPEATDQEVHAPPDRLASGDWIASLPNGLERKSASAAAAFRWASARSSPWRVCCCKIRQSFILDEATASIDPLTETLIQEGLDTVLQGRTSIVIAHRLSTIRHADRIIVLRKGAIIEQGTHDELLQRGGHYAELYNTYFRHQSIEYIENMGALAAD